jgi:hypothetical protein
MANISLYVSGQTELNDVTEFFQKRLIGEGENPIAFFDGVFYESHQERVGNIVFQDYLIYTDKAIYLWARGTSKDFLDRFTLGSVSVNSRNKDSAFATLNLKIKREGKEPVYVIFDMVEIKEAETIVKLHTVIESTIEDYLGVNFRQEIPQDTAVKILQSARSICIPRSISIALEAPEMPVPDAGIGYGQDLLEQYKASIGYSLDQDPQQQGAQPRPRGGMGAPELPRGLEGLLPADPASIKRIAGQLKDMVGDAPLKLREQLMKDLQHVPNDVATVLTALNELLANIAGNPQAERFVMTAIKTAVANDGILGSVGKIIKLTSGIGGGGGKKSSRPESSASGDGSSRQNRNSSRHDDDDDDLTIRRRKISVRDDSDVPGGYDPFSDVEPAASAPRSVPEETAPASPRRPTPFDSEDDSAPRRKKLSIKTEDDAADEIARKLMSYDESERDQPSAPVASAALRDMSDADATPRRKKLSIKAEQDDKDEIARKLMSYDESERDQPPVSAASAPLSDPDEADAAPRRKKLAIKAEDDNLSEIARTMMSYDEAPVDEQTAGAQSDMVAEPAPEAPVRKKIQIKAPEPDEALSISEDELLSAISPDGAGNSQDNYLTLESDLPVPEPAAKAPSEDRTPEAGTAASGKARHGGKRDNESGKHSDKQSV